MEYARDKCLIRISNKLQMEQEIMNKNETRFKLAYTSLIFKWDIINSLG